MKNLFAYSVITFTIMVILTLVIIIEDKLSSNNYEVTTVIKETKKDIKKEMLDKLNNIDKKIDYFKYDYLKRYVAYKEKNKNLQDKEIITRVNIGLDKPYYEDTKSSKNLNKNTILVNKYTYLDKEYIPNNLTEISKEYSNSTKKLVYEAKEAFEKMASAAKEQGYTIRAISAYRSYEYQKGLYDNYVAKDGIEKADTYSARPGYSEHQTGLAVDIDNKTVDYNNFESTEEFKWMDENAHLYGFILRYPKDKEYITGYDYESWHYRYVGETIAKFIKNNNITFDEYYVIYIDK